MTPREEIGVNKYFILFAAFQLVGREQAGHRELPRELFLGSMMQLTLGLRPWPRALKRLARAG